MTSNGLPITSGNVLDVLSGGTTVSIAVSSGGFEYVAAGGTAGGTKVSSGGYEYVASDGPAHRLRGCDGDGLGKSQAVDQCVGDVVREVAPDRLPRKLHTSSQEPGVVRLMTAGGPIIDLDQCATASIARPCSSNRAIRVRAEVFTNRSHSR
jgi:autotransporter passenger strand-loop-strand repeat protein